MSLTRKQFLQHLLLAGGSVALPGRLCAQSAGEQDYDFYFTRLMYESGDWDVDQRMPSNVLNSLIEYTSLKVDPNERIVPLADPAMVLAPFCYLAGHKLVEFTAAEAKNFRDYVNRGGFVFVDDCNHDIDGLFAKSFEAQMAKLFGDDCLQKLPDDHDLYRCFFRFEELPVTSFELNGWGDDLVHDYLKAIVVNGRIAVLYSNKDFGCEWDYDYRNKRWLAIDNTKFAVNIVIYALTT
ncbi:DUF4159 domain-containing protein [Microbulbifer pacificus]|uniref:DUF4159 domain-containing protein n=1 Tax=Microbulbifer pacificus TaxID=407164 RepID=UPI000CF552AC|nr:DUF4159 domain-containing protein [Microbulbifer pacificus]